MIALVKIFRNRQKHFFWKKIFSPIKKFVRIVYKFQKNSIIGTILEQISGLEIVRTCSVRISAVQKSNAVESPVPSNLQVFNTGKKRTSRPKYSCCRNCNDRRGQSTIQPLRNEKYTQTVKRRDSGSFETASVDHVAFFRLLLYFSETQGYQERWLNKDPWITNTVTVFQENKSSQDKIKQCKVD